LKFGIEALIEYKIYKGLVLFSEINYNSQLWVDGDDFHVEYTSDSGDYSQLTFKSPSMAAIRLAFGLGYNF
jgi:hypothetical protein